MFALAAFMSVATEYQSSKVQMNKNAWLNLLCNKGNYLLNKWWFYIEDMLKKVQELYDQEGY